MLDKQTDIMATSGTEEDKNTKHAQIKSAVQKTEKTRQMSRQTCSRFGILGQPIISIWFASVVRRRHLCPCLYLLSSHISTLINRISTFCFNSTYISFYSTLLCIYTIFQLLVLWLNGVVVVDRRGRWCMFGRLESRYLVGNHIFNCANPLCIPVNIWAD